MLFSASCKFYADAARRSRVNWACWTCDSTRREKFSRRATYDYQLEAFAAAVEDGAPFPTTAVDAIRTMELIDATYVAAGLPIRQPTPVD